VCTLCPAGVFMEKPHPLYTHTSSSAFKFSTHQQHPSTSTSNAHRTSVKPNSNTNQTGNNTWFTNIHFLFISNLSHYSEILYFVLLFRLFTHSVHIKVGPRLLCNPLPLLPQHQHPLPVETVQHRA